MPEGLPAPLTIRIPTDLAFVRPVRKMIEGLLAAQSWGEDDVADAGLVATEVVQNAVEHGSRNDGTETVEISCALTAGAVVIDVVDPGTGKGPEALLARDVTAPPPADSPRGRGLYLIHRMVREFDRRLDPRGGSFIRVRLGAGMPVP